MSDDLVCTLLEASRTSSILRVSDGHAVSTDDELAVEEPLEIQLEHGPQHDRRTKSISVTMRTPGNDAELAAGFLLSEGVIHDFDDLENAEDLLHASGPAANELQRRSTITLKLRPDLTVPDLTLERNFYTTSSCGVCGKASLMALRVQAPPRAANNFHIASETLYSLTHILEDRQQIFSRTGGLHAAGLVSSSGQLLAVREDVGRHNAVDKLFGNALLSDALPLRDSLLFLSGRASFELLQKSVMAGIPMVVALGAPSSLAVDVARQFDITLVGFLKSTRFNIYHGASRITHFEKETVA
ncbi:formate dehydrogenase accessory sulfurtransferase FdhD [Terriglobus tenax]|uniref:formate dehydrogenase accessory sulfurtransferase FdhD n=1 Tax=Terriglobus tenax TaxID=1111115 RepID=UPI0021DFB772|nr:formate dehydrogenase accessory sulfurtransferase FdhD [Terriglobus tenax]